MKKHAIFLSAALLLVLSVSAPMAAARWTMNKPELFIQGTTATCSVDYQSAKTTDDVVITLTLWQGSKKINSWANHDTGSVVISETQTVERGKTYKLTMTPVVNGVIQSAVSVTAKS